MNCSRVDRRSFSQARCARSPRSSPPARLPPRNSDAEDRAAIARFREAFEAAENAGDAQALRRYIADDAVAMAPDMPPVTAP
jgi:hypothetical protein